jgi:hypothetical protein
LVGTAVAGTAVGGTGTAVGGTGAFVGGTAVAGTAVGGAGVCAGWQAVTIAAVAPAAPKIFRKERRSTVCSVFSCSVTASNLLVFTERLLGWMF